MDVHNSTGEVVIDTKNVIPNIQKLSNPCQPRVISNGPFGEAIVIGTLLRGTLQTSLLCLRIFFFTFYGPSVLLLK